MESLRELYRIGTGPSSSHTMGPRRAALVFLDRVPDATAYRATLYGSLASTGRGHLTDAVLRQVFSGCSFEIIWQPEVVLPFHPNGMKLEAFGIDATLLDEWVVYSVGGGKITDEAQAHEEDRVYPHNTLDAVLKHLEKSGQALWEYVLEAEPKLEGFLEEIWTAMSESLKRGLRTEGVLPGGLNLGRKAAQLYRKARLAGNSSRRTALLMAYACAVSEENAATRALTCAESALLSDGVHRVSFDQVIEVMKQTGHDLPSLYRETSLGGLAKASRSEF